MKLMQGSGGDFIRIPTILTAPDGKCYAFANVRVGTSADNAAETKIIFSMRSPEGEWTAPRIIASRPGWAYSSGAPVCDESTGKIMYFFRKSAVVLNEFGNKVTPEQRAELARQKEAECGDREGSYILETFDGISFSERKIEIEPLIDPRIHYPTGSRGSTHGSSAGITLKYGQYAGRLVIPARLSIHKVDTWADLMTGSSNTVLYSDDHGDSWKTGGIVEPGTGEGTLAERSDGSIYYNSRAYFNDKRRHEATSTDGGLTFTGQRIIDDLIESCCNACMIRVERGGKVLFFFANPNSETERIDMSVKVSTDEGESWRLLEVIDNRKSGYSGIIYDRKSDSLLVMYEAGETSYIDEIALTAVPLSRFNF